MPTDQPEDLKQTPPPESTSTSRLYADAYQQISLFDRTTASAATGDRAVQPTGDRAAGNQPAERPKDQHEEKNPDGSKVLMGKAADGKDHPLKITYTDGRSTEYIYGPDGKVTGMNNIEADGTVKESYKSSDGKHFIDQVSGKTLDGTMSVNRDGTGKFTDAQGNSIEGRTDGRAVWHVKDAQGQEHKLLLNRDGSSVEFKKAADGKEHPTNVRFPDGRETTYEYNKDGKITSVTDWGVGGEAGGQRLLKYTTENGKDWKEAYGRAPEIHGSLTLKDEGLHTFNDAITGNTFVRETDGTIIIKDKTGQDITPQNLRPRARARK
jgi:YD repeat-containing protein